MITYFTHGYNFCIETIIIIHHINIVIKTKINSDSMKVFESEIILVFNYYINILILYWVYKYLRFI